MCMCCVCVCVCVCVHACCVCVGACVLHARVCACVWDTPCIGVAYLDGLVAFKRTVSLSSMVIIILS